MSQTNDPIEWYRRMQLLRRFETHDIEEQEES